MICRLLAERETRGNPIRIAAVGCDWTGTGLLAALRHVPGMEVSILVDGEPERAAHLLERVGGVAPERIVITDSPGKAQDVLVHGRVVATSSLETAVAMNGIDVYTDLTTSPASGAATALAAIEAGHDTVLINIEADATVGAELRRLARENGVLYTISSGHVPGALIQQWDMVTSLGYTPVVVGKGVPGVPDAAGTPDTVPAVTSGASAGHDGEHMDPFLVTADRDGTRTMFEMCCVANVTGCKPFQPGMVGPEATIETVSQVFALVRDGGLSRFAGAVDYVRGPSMAGGVFVVVRIEDRRVCADLTRLGAGSGNYFTFFRPNRLWYLETPVSLALAVLHHGLMLTPRDHPSADVVAVAKRDLRAGERLDSLGGHTFRGLIHPAPEPEDHAAAAIHGGGTAAVSDCVHDALPAGLAPGARLKHQVKAGATIAWSDVELDETATIVKLRRSQDARLAAGR